MKNKVKAVLRGWFRFLVRMLIKVQVEGRDNLPASGPLIVIINHFSWFDVPLLYLFLPYREMRFMGAEVLQENGLYRFLFKFFDVVPVPRGQFARTALRRVEETIQAGNIVMLAPEGGIHTESMEKVHNGQYVAIDEGTFFRDPAVLLPARPGVAYVAVRSGSPILPVGIVGADRVIPTWQQLRRPRVVLRAGPVFGPMVVPAELRGRERREMLDRFGEQMMNALAAQLPSENRGPFG